jgi:cardiolipin synthase
VRVRILVEGDITDAMPVKYASRQAYDTLMARGIQIYEYRPSMMHTKTFVVDGILSIFGSANFDNRSHLEQDLRASERLDLEKWRRRSLLQKSREYFWSCFGEVF